MASFLWGAAGQKMSPQQVAEQNKVARALMQEASDTSPVGHWTAALNRGLQGYLGGRQAYQAREAENAGRSAAMERFNSRSTANPVAQALAGGATPASAGGADGFLASLVNSESGGNWNALNNEGYGGRLQFGAARLADAASAGIIPAGIDGAAFSAMSPEQQMAVEQWHFNDIENQARRMGLDKYVGQVVGGVPITMEAIKGMAHLGGIGGTSRFLESGGQYNPADSNGTSLRDYGLRHGGAGAGSYAAPSAGNVSEIAALLADEWLPDSARSVLQAEMQQQMGMQQAAFQQQLQQQDPMRQLEMQRAQLELEQMRNPQAKPIEVGGVLLDPNTFQPIFDSRADKATPDIQNYEYYRAGAEARGEQAMPFEQFKATIARAGSGGNPLVGSIPAGMRAVTDPLTGDVIGLEAIPGGPAAAEAQKLAETAGRKDENAATATSVVTSAAQRARDALRSPMSGGLVGAATSYLPNSEAAEVYRQVDVLKSNATVENLNAMRAASPTGGALGSVTEKEGAMLAAKSGALDPKSPYFERDLADYELTLLRTIHGNTEGSRLFDEMYPDGVAGIRGNKVEPPSSEQSGQNAPARPKSKAEYDDLPSGATFIAPDGTTRRKP